MRNERDRLIRKGAAVNPGHLIEQGNTTLALVEEQRVRFAEHGFGDDAVDVLRSAVNAVSTGLGTKDVRRSQARSATRRQEKAVDDAKAFVRRLRLALPLAMEGVEGLQFDQSAFYSGRLGRSTPRIYGYLVRIRGHVATLDGRLAPYFKGQSAFAQLRAVETALAERDAVQEVAHDTAPSGTRDLNECKGRLLDLLERVNRIAKLAFEDEPHVARRFNKDILKRGRRRRPRKATEGAAPASAASSA